MPYFDKEKEAFYKEVITIFRKNSLSFFIGGGLATLKYAPDLGRETKDLDIFCKAGDYPKILSIFKQEGYTTTVIDDRWLAKIKKDKHYFDLIFSSPNYIAPVDDTWFQHVQKMSVLGIDLNIIAPEELIWCKAYIQDRNHFDGGDINHIILNQGKILDWKRLLIRMESHWELLLSLLLNFRFVYPSERGLVPKWIMKELMARLDKHLEAPIPKDKICRGPLLSRYSYQVDIEKGGFKTIS